MSLMEVKRQAEERGDSDTVNAVLNMTYDGPLPEKLADGSYSCIYTLYDYNIAGIASADGRHVAMMPHLERCIFPWQCGNYPLERRADEVTPWIEAFVNARIWVENQK